MGEFHNNVVWFKNRQVISPTYKCPQKPTLGMEKAKCVSQSKMDMSCKDSRENLMKDLSAQASQVGPVCSLGQV